MQHCVTASVNRHHAPGCPGGAQSAQSCSTWNAAVRGLAGGAPAQAMARMRDNGRVASILQSVLPLTEVPRGTRSLWLPPSPGPHRASGKTLEACPPFAGRDRGASIPTSVPPTIRIGAGEDRERPNCVPRGTQRRALHPVATSTSLPEPQQHQEHGPCSTWNRASPAPPQQWHQRDMRGSSSTRNTGRVPHEHGAAGFDITPAAFQATRP